MLVQFRPNSDPMWVERPRNMSPCGSGVHSPKYLKIKIILFLNPLIAKIVVFNNISNIQPLEVVDRGSETQLRVGENLNKIPQRDKGYQVI